MAERDAPGQFKPIAYDGASGGWGSVKGMAKVMLRQRPYPAVLDTLLHQNKAEGHMCTGCAWGKPSQPHRFEFCENGAKATMWELTSDRCSPAFFAQHSVSELRGWSDYDLEMQGRLTHPLRYDPASDHYVETTWDEAFAAIGAQIRAVDPKAVTFYASGRASLEASYLYALFARMVGNNNLPDSSNMCHETTSVALKKAIGVPVGTCTLDDFEHCDALFYFGQNPGTNSPRFLHNLQAAKRRGCRMVVFNPVRETGLIAFRNPQEPLQMTVGAATDLADLYLQVSPGGDIAAIMGLIKQVIAIDGERRAAGGKPVIDEGFLAEHCAHHAELRARAEATGWDEIEHHCGLTREQLAEAARIYADAASVIGVYGMGLTQHVRGGESISMLVNLLLLGGHIGRPGAGICPVRGHSNVQGQRTVGISEKPELVPLDKLAAMFGFDPPCEKGVTTVEVCEQVMDGRMKGFVGLGGNFARAIPEQGLMDEAWGNLDFTAQVATKLNRSHVLVGKAAWLLPCLARSERHEGAGGLQAVSMEDSFSHVHGSIGRREPASPHLLSEVAIICDLAKATVRPHPRWLWDEWRADFGRIRELIAETYPEQFADMSARMFAPGGFYRGNKARELVWLTQSGKAEFTLPSALTALGVGQAPGRFHLITMRSNDQFNTTIYGHDDRLRGIEGSRMIVLISPAEMAAHGLAPDDKVMLVSDAGDGVDRRVGPLSVKPFALPAGCLGGYYPEMNPLVPLWYHDEASKTPAAKSVPVRIERV